MEKNNNYNLSKSNKSIDKLPFSKSLKDSFAKLRSDEQLCAFEGYSALEQFSCFELVRNEDKLKAFKKLKGFKCDLFKCLPDADKKEAFAFLSQEELNLYFRVSNDYKIKLEIYNRLRYEDRVKLFGCLEHDDMLNFYNDFKYEDRVKLLGYLKTSIAIKYFKELHENEKSSSYVSFMDSNIELAMYAFKYLPENKKLEIFKLINSTDLKEFVFCDLPYEDRNLENFKMLDDKAFWHILPSVRKYDKLSAFKYLIDKNLEGQSYFIDLGKLTDIFVGIPDKDKLSAFKYLIDKFFIPYSCCFIHRICNLFHLSVVGLVNELAKNNSKLYPMHLSLPNDKQITIYVCADPSEIINKINVLDVMYSRLPICDRLEAFRHLTVAFAQKTENDFRHQFEYYLYSSFWSNLFVACFRFVCNITAFKYLDPKFYFACFEYLSDSDKLEAFSFIPKENQKWFFGYLKSIKSDDILKFLEMLTKDHSDYSLDLGSRFLKEMSVNNKDSYLKLIENTAFCFEYFNCLPYDDRLKCFRKFSDEQRVKCYGYLSDQDKKAAFNLISNEKKRDIFCLYALSCKTGALGFFINMSEEDKLHIIEKVKDMTLNVSDPIKSQKLLELMKSLNNIKERKKKTKLDSMLDDFERKSIEAKQCILNCAEERYKKDPSEKLAKVIRLLDDRMVKRVKEEPLQASETQKKHYIDYK